jgi:uncharacterized protein
LNRYNNLKSCAKLKIVMKNKYYVRRWLRLAALSLLFLISFPPAKAQPVARETMLRDLAHGVIATGYQSLAVKCQTLTNAVGQLAETPDQTSLDQARQAWIAAADAANQMRCFQIGPVADRQCVATFYYSRVSPHNTEVVLHSTNTVNQAFLEELGADVKGLFALEYLLFGQKAYPGIAANASSVLEMLTAQDSARRRTYLLAVACDVENKAAQLAKDWNAPGAQGAAAKFAAGGQASINQLVNQLAHALEEIGDRQINFALVLPAPLSGQVYRVERNPSGSSLSGVLAYLEGVEKFYGGAHGPGLADVVKEVNANLAGRIADQFTVAIAATRAIGEPLEQAAADKREAVQKAHAEVHALEILFKVDLASALGVTISFSSADGD